MDETLMPEQTPAEIEADNYFSGLAWEYINSDQAVNAVIGG